ncbi:MAG: diacylglycerol kinase family protein [Longimicrobiales bacterium]|nr:diacylglycerol kinase family protein [Longimicrobiales bacterium]
MASHLLIVNPAAGSGQGRERAKAFTDALPPGSDFHLRETDQRGSAVRIAREGARDYDRIIAVGGDGTLNEVLSGLMEAREEGDGEMAALAFLPSGTANGAVRAFGLTTEPQVAARSLADAETLTVDVGMVSYEGGERPYLIRFGAGLDAAVLEELNASRSGVMGFVGLARSLPRIVAVMRGYSDPAIAIEVDGVDFGSAASVVLPNVAEVGLQATVVEDADPADGQLEVLAVSMPTKWSIVKLGLRMVASSLASAPEVRKTRGRTVRLSSEADAPFQMDGEPVGTLPVEVKLVPGAIRLLLT